MLGKVQKDWLKAELKGAKGKYPLVIWINSVPWISAKEEQKDYWAGFTTERDELGDFIDQEGLNNLCMLSGDMHRMAIDDGSNNKPPTGRGGFPVFQAAPLDKSFRKLKGGPYSSGVLNENHLYGLVTVEDGGGKKVTVTFQGKSEGGPVAKIAPLTFKPPR
jgi:hypothetical protein